MHKVTTSGDRNDPTFANGVVKQLSVAVAVILSAMTVFLPQARAQTGVYTVNGQTAAQTSQTFAATQTDQSAVYVLNAGYVILTNCTMTKTGDASDVGNSSENGVNAGALANSAGIIAIVGGSVTTNASGGNGLFATGSGSAVTMSNGEISTFGSGSHGIDATNGGVISLTDVNVTTTGDNSSALATDIGGGSVVVNGGAIAANATTPGSHSAGIYSTGDIAVSDATVTSMGDCGGVIDGPNTMALTNTDLTGVVEGIKVWKTAPDTGSATLAIYGGSLTSTNGDAFLITGETGNPANVEIFVANGAAISAGSGTLVNVSGASTASFSVEADTLAGNLLADETSSLDASLLFSTSLTGSIQNASLTMDASSAWNVTENSTLTILADPEGISGQTVANIVGNGNDVHYDAGLTENAYLGGQVYSLVNGGVLTPASVSSVDNSPSNVPAGWALDQNYPNPFNPSTIIPFELGKKSHVTIEVYNVQGQRVAVLVNQDLGAGSYEIPFDGSNLTSGIYFYRLNANGFIETKKMVFQK